MLFVRITKFSIIYLWIRVLSSLELPEFVGNLNLYNTPWGSGHNDAQGRLIESFLLSGARAFNKKQPTYSNTNNSYPNIDSAVDSVEWPLTEVITLWLFWSA